MQTITITDQHGTYEAQFEPVRTIRHLTIGWATFAHDGFDYRFPAIVDAAHDRVVTVSDWQQVYSAVWPDLDLSDPEQVRDLIDTGNGSFVVPKTGRPSMVVNVFAM